MAELNVQPKKKTSILPWLLLLLGIAALVWFLTRGQNGRDTAERDAVVTTPTTNTNTSSHTATANWGDVDFNAPAVSYEEITGSDINVRGNNHYGIYGLGENILFDENKATIRPQAEENLRQITGSISKRFNGGEVRVYGFTDAQGSAGYNKELAEQRAEAVRAWMQNNGIDAGRISVNAVGEAQPVASNSTEEGRQQNRRVEIVARNASGTAAQ